MHAAPTISHFVAADSGGTHLQPLAANHHQGAHASARSKAAGIARLYDRE